MSVQADFMKLPFPDNHFDGVYAIEATCHAPVREDVYSQIYRVLKPGQVFACYEWCLTPLYDGNDSLHRYGGELCLLFSSHTYIQIHTSSYESC